MSEPVSAARPDGVRVTATGRASAVPDVLVVQVAAEAQSPDVGQALATASGAMAAMVARLREAGLADRDLRTTGVSLGSRVDDAGRAVGHVAVQRLAATLRDPAGAGTLLPAVLGAGGQHARLDGMRFTLDDDAAVVRAARDDAWERARLTAGQHAERAGRALGRVLHVAEGPSNGGPVVRAMAMAAPGGAMPVESGEHEVTVTIEVEWAFSP